MSSNESNTAVLGRPTAADLAAPVADDIKLRGKKKAGKAPKAPKVASKKEGGGKKHAGLEFLRRGRRPPGRGSPTLALHNSEPTPT